MILLMVLLTSPFLFIGFWWLFQEVIIPSIKRRYQ